MTKRRSYSAKLQPDKARTIATDADPSDESIDLSQLDKVMKQTIPGRLLTQGDPLLLTIAEQVQQLLERIQAMEAAQTTLVTRLERLETQLRQDTKAAVVEIGALKNELLGERRTSSVMGIFNGILPTLDSLRLIRATFDKNSDPVVTRQVDTVIVSLTMMLRGLGFIEFEVEVGAPFDPTCMECTEYAQGEPGFVLGITRTGYRTQTGVVRPTGVCIADPLSP
jgi:molecular chaperone GrpE (heat shock protein)